MRAILVQGDSVRMTWGISDASEEEHRRPLRRDPPLRPEPLAPTDDPLSLRLSEELDYARRTLDAMGDELSGDPILIRRHAVALQSLDIVGQILNHVASVVRSSDRNAAVRAVSLGDLRARLMRTGSL